MPFFKLETDEIQETKHLDGLGFSLCELLKNDYTYPVKGWYWFDTEDQARLFFDLPPIAQVQAPA